MDGEPKEQPRWLTARMSDESTETQQTADTAAETPTTEKPAQAETDWQAEARKWEQRAKANKTAASELEKLRQSQMTEQERAVEAAKAEARAETIRGFGGRLVDAEVRAAAAGRLDAERLDALLEGLDRSRFLTEDGEVDREALSGWVNKVVPPAGPRRATGDIDQGVRSTSTASTSDQFAAAIDGLI